MARPAKSVHLQNKHLTTEERDTREKVEAVLKGADDNIKPPSYLNKDQKAVFRFIVSQLSQSGILSNLDIYTLATCAVAIDRIKYIEKSINEDTTLLMNKDMMASKEKYTKDYFRCCNELCLSPQARAKIGSLNLSVKAEDPLEKVLGGGTVE